MINVEMRDQDKVDVFWRIKRIKERKSIASFSAYNTKGMLYFR